MKSKELVVLDVDGTLLKGLSQQILLNFLFKEGEISLFYYARVYYWFVMYKFGLKKDPKKIMEFALQFLSNKSIDEIDSILDLFLKKEIIPRVFIEMKEIIEAHKKNNRDLIVLSNVIEPLIKKISKYLIIDNYISTKLVHSNGVYTGEIDGNIMYGEEKVSALIKFAEINGYSLSDCWAYADHHSDIPLLKSVGHPHVVNPDKVMKSLALHKKWPLHDIGLVQ